MTLALALILAGILLIYAGIKGESIRELLVGRAGVRSQKPQAVER